MTQVSDCECFIALGANLPAATRTPTQTLECTLELFEAESLRLVNRSSWYHTPAFPAGSGPDFVNGVVQVRTDLTARAVLDCLHRIEEKMGRTRQNRWEARICDLDLISYNHSVLPDMDTYRSWLSLPLEQQKKQAPDDLILPHPRLQDRSFVLVPMQEIAPDWVHPVSGLSVDQMVANLPKADKDAVRRSNNP